MAVNPWAGEVALVLDGVPWRCRLTLGSLASMEAGGGAAGGLVALIERFEAGRFGAADVLAVLLAGLRGGGWPGDAEALGAAQIDGGLPEALRVAALLLRGAFDVTAVSHDSAV